VRPSYPEDPPPVFSPSSLANCLFCPQPPLSFFQRVFIPIAVAEPFDQREVAVFSSFFALVRALQFCSSFSGRHDLTPASVFPSSFLPIITPPCSISVPASNSPPSPFSNRRGEATEVFLRAFFQYSPFRDALLNFPLETFSWLLFLFESVFLRVCGVVGLGGWWGGVGEGGPQLFFFFWMFFPHKDTFRFEPSTSLQAPPFCTFPEPPCCSQALLSCSPRRRRTATRFSRFIRFFGVPPSEFTAPAFGHPQMVVYLDPLIPLPQPFHIYSLV